MSTAQQRVHCLNKFAVDDQSNGLTAMLEHHIHAGLAWSLCFIVHYWLRPAD